MLVQFMRKAGFLLLSVAILGACAAPPAEANPNPTPIERTAAPPATLSPTLKASPTQAQTDNCSTIPLGESLPIMISSKGDQLTPVDPQDGLPVCGYKPLSFRNYFQYAFSPGHQVLAITDEGDGASADTRLHLVNLESWQAITSTVSIAGWVNSLVFNPAGTQLAMLTFQPQGDLLDVVDLNSQDVLKRQMLDFSPDLMRYTPNGDQLVLFGGVQNSQANVPLAHLLVLETQDYNPAWETQFTGMPDGMRVPEGESSDPILDQWGPAASLSQDGHSLFVLHADGTKLTTIDLKSHQFSTQNVRRKISWLDKLMSLGAQTAYAKGVNGTTWQGVLSSDGRFYVIGVTNTTEKDASGGWNFSSTSLGLQMIDVKTGEVLAQIDTDASQLGLSPDGSRLYLQGWKDNVPWTEVVSTDGLKVIRRLDNTFLEPAKLLNGKTILMSSQTAPQGIRLGIVNPQTLKSQNSWTLNLPPWQMDGGPGWLSP